MSESLRTADRAYERASRRYSASFMSNAKWLRLFRAAAKSPAASALARWELISESDHFWQPLPYESELLPSRFQDGRFQPFEYKWIRSVFVPREYRPVARVGFVRQQPVEALRQAIEAVGQFQLEETPDGLTIVAYRV